MGDAPIITPACQEDHSVSLLVLYLNNERCPLNSLSRPSKYGALFHGEERRGEVRRGEVR
jgi:hypothetical protein